MHEDQTWVNIYCIQSLMPVDGAGIRYTGKKLTFRIVGTPRQPQPRNIEFKSTGCSLRQFGLINERFENGSIDIQDDCSCIGLLYLLRWLKWCCCRNANSQRRRGAKQGK